MYSLFQLDGSSILKSKIEEMDFHKVKWLDVHAPNQKLLTQLSEITKIPLRDLKNYSDPDEIPRVVEQEHFSVIIFKSSGKRGVTTYERSTTSVAFIVSEKLIITLHQEDVPSFDEVKQLSDEELAKIMSKGTGEMLYNFMEHMMHRYLRTLDDVEEEINKIEDAVLLNPDSKLVKKVFQLKKTLIYFQKATSANRDIFVALQKEFGEKIDDESRKRITHLYYDVAQIIDVVTTYRDILTGTLDIYLSAVNNNMNKVMKKMAAYGTIVLVPTFITGLYGMNFDYLPEIHWKYGYLFAWGLIIGSVMALSIYFKHKDWF